MMFHCGNGVSLMKTLDFSEKVVGKENRKWYKFLMDLRKTFHHYTPAQADDMEFRNNLGEAGRHILFIAFGMCVGYGVISLADKFIFPNEKSTTAPSMTINSPN